MLRLIRRPIFWLIALAVLALGSTGMVMANQAKAKKAAAIAAKPADSPFAANGCSRQFIHESFTCCP